MKYLSGSQAASSIGCASRAESKPSVRNCIRYHLKDSGRKVLGSVAIYWSAAVCSGNIPEDFQIWFQKDRSLEAFRSRIETVVPRPPPLTPSYRLFYSLDFGHSRLFSAFLGHLRAHLKHQHMLAPCPLCINRLAQHRPAPAFAATSNRITTYTNRL